MNNFVDRLRDANLLSAADAYDFDRILTYCNGLGAFVGGSARNLELLASFLASLRLASPEFEIPGCKTHKTPGKALRLIVGAMHQLLYPDITTEAVYSSGRADI